MSAGDRLPTHRELAWELGVTVGTVSRAYAELERTGLVSGEVGRGTYVRRGNAEDFMIPGEDSGEGFIDLAKNYLPRERRPWSCRAPSKRWPGIEA